MTAPWRRQVPFPTPQGQGCAPAASGIHPVKDIAQRLGLSVKTVESHRTRRMHKLDIHETATLVRYAIRRRLTTV
jgi:Bacterial regulatory proteins, luxR family